MMDVGYEDAGRKVGVEVIKMFWVSPLHFG
jgi:hypothetical protein